MTENEMDSNYVDSEKSAELESPRKIYQEIEETSRQLNVSSSRCTKMEDLFSSDIIAKRLQIKNLCEKLISNYSPKTYGSFAREKLWKYVFYDAVQRARKLQRDKPWSPLQLAYIKSHLLTGIAQLHFFTLKIQECPEYAVTPLLSHPCSLDGILNEDMVLIQKSRASTQDDRVDQKKLVELLSMCFINIGDLYRYLRDIYSKVDDICGDSLSYFIRAQEWYTHAFLMNPSAGLSLNQLGNIYSDRNWGIDSAYYLLYSALTDTAYEGAVPNLRQLLDSKMVQFARRPASPEPKPMEVLCNGFTSLLYYLLFEDTHLINYEKVCQDTLASFHERLVTYDPDLDDKLLFKFAGICVMVVWRLQTVGSVHTSPAVGFAMSIFFQLVNQLGVILDEHARVEKVVETFARDIDELSVGSSAPANKYELNPEILVVNTDTSLRKTKHRKRMGTCRGPRRHSSNVLSDDSAESELDEDGSNDESDDDSNWSESDYTTSSEDEELDMDRDRRSVPGGELEEFNGKAFDTSSSNGRSETSGSGSGGNSQKSLEGIRQDYISSLNIPKNRETPEGPVLQNVANQGRMTINAEDLLKCQSQIEPLLVALTPFMRWLETCPAVKDALAANAEKVFLEKLCGILTLFASENWADTLEGVTLKELGKDWIELVSNTDEDIGNGEEHLFRVELSEDRSMLGLPILQKYVRGLQINDHLTSSDELMIRIGRFLCFGFWMNKTGSFSMLYEEDEKRFFVPTPEMLKSHLRFSKMKKLIEGKSGSESLIRLTRAYQEMKVSDRGKRDRHRRRYRGPDDGRNSRRGRRSNRIYGSGKRPRDDKPICAVVDFEATMKKLDIIKQLSSNENFVVCIPHSVWEALDLLKDTNQVGAADSLKAYLWMDQARLRNHPGLRTLKSNEKLTINSEYPTDPSDLEVWDFFDMLECCNYLIQKEFGGKPYDYIHPIFGDYRDKYSVFYLSGNDSLLDTSIKRGFDPIKIARSIAGVYVDCIALYPPRPPKKGRKWQTSGKCKG